MKTIYNGKTKAVLADEEKGAVYLLFKDDLTGENGVFDLLQHSWRKRRGKGKIGLIISRHFLNC